MGIDRHELEHRNYKPGRPAPAHELGEDQPLPETVVVGADMPLAPADAKEKTSASKLAKRGSPSIQPAIEPAPRRARKPPAR